DRYYSLPPLTALVVRDKSRILIQVAAADDAEEPLRHGLGRRGDGDPTAVAGGIDVAGRGALRGAAHTAADLVRELVDRGLGTEDREDRLEEAQADDLAAAAVDHGVAPGDDSRPGGRTT